MAAAGAGEILGFDMIILSLSQPRISRRCHEALV